MEDDDEDVDNTRVEMEGSDWGSGSSLLYEFIRVLLKEEFSLTLNKDNKHMGLGNRKYLLIKNFKKCLIPFLQ